MIRNILSCMYSDLLTIDLNVLREWELLCKGWHGAGIVPGQVDRHPLQPQPARQPPTTTATDCRIIVRGIAARWQCDHVGGDGRDEEYARLRPCRWYPDQEGGGRATVVPLDVQLRQLAGAEGELAAKIGGAAPLHPLGNAKAFQS